MGPFIKQKNVEFTLETLAGSIAAAFAVLWSFLWYPVAAALSGFALLFFGSLWIARRAGGWYNSFYEEQDHPTIFLEEQLPHVA